jgi:hypothetical protein
MALVEHSVLAACCSALRCGCDEEAKQFLEPREVSVELAAGVVPEPSRCLAGGEAENGCADEAFRLGEALVIDARFLECGVDAVPGAACARCRGRSLEKEWKDTPVALSRRSDRVRESREPIDPGSVGGWGELGEEQLDDPVEQVGLVGHMAVQRHGRDPEPRGDGSHGESLQARFVSDGQAGGEDDVSVDARRPAHPVSIYSTLMRILMTDGSGLTARQTANRLWAAGHVVEALAPDPFCLCRFTRHVHRIRRVPAYGRDPLAWLDAALAIYAAGHFDVLFPTQEQVAVLASVPERLHDAGVATAVPPFAAVAAVQDKLSAFATLSRLGLPQPETATGPDGWTRFPAYVKEPIGTASGGVRRVTTLEELTSATLKKRMVVQAAVDGPLAMCQSVFDRGSMVAFHANLRAGEGANGGASHKRSVDLPQARTWLEILGADLRWHGALSADVIVTDAGPTFVDINPRLVEPENAWKAGVDLVGAMVDVACGAHPSHQADGPSGVTTHQLLLAVLGAAQQGGGRRRVAAELLAGCRHTGPYAASVEELTQAHHDPMALVPLAMASVATLIRPASWSWFASGSVDNYALTPDGWEQILAGVARP